MKPVPDFEPDDREFHLHFCSLMHKFQAAGLVRHFEEEPDADGNFVVEWNDDNPKEDGKTLFYMFATTLRRMSASGLPSADELVIVEILRQSYFVD
jgi:hypothetical protein